MESFTTYALGFPIVILNPKIKIRAGERTLDINYDALAKLAFPAVIKKPARLTGGEVKFIRGYLGLTQSEFANQIGLSDHSPVSKWEKISNALTKMSLHQEFSLRVKCLRLAGFRLTNEIEDMFENLKIYSDTGETIELDANHVA